MLTLAFRWTQSRVWDKALGVWKKMIWGKSKVFVGLKEAMQKSLNKWTLSRLEKAWLGKFITKMQQSLSTMSQWKQIGLYGTQVTRHAKGFEVFMRAGKPIKKNSLVSMQEWNIIKNSNYTIVKEWSAFKATSHLDGTHTTFSSTKKLLEHVNSPIRFNSLDATDVLEKTLKRRLAERWEISLMQGIRSVFSVNGNNNALTRRTERLRWKTVLKDAQLRERKVRFVAGEKAPTFTRVRSDWSKQILKIGSDDWNSLALQLESKMIDSMTGKWNKILQSHELMGKKVPAWILEKLWLKTQATLQDYAASIWKKVEDWVIGDFIAAYDRMIWSAWMKQWFVNSLRFFAGDAVAFKPFKGNNIGVTKQLTNATIKQANRLFVLSQVWPALLNGDIMEGGTDVLLRWMLARSIPLKIVTYLTGIDNIGGQLTGDESDA